METVPSHPFVYFRLGHPCAQHINIAPTLPPVDFGLWCAQRMVSLDSGHSDSYKPPLFLFLRQVAEQFVPPVQLLRLATT